MSTWTELPKNDSVEVRACDKGKYYIKESVYMNIKYILLILTVTVLQGCHEKSTKFGKAYNQIRKTYGSPIIHEYMRLKSTSDDFEHWRTPESTNGKFDKGFHYGKGFYIHEDSVLQEDDVFRIRINDSTYQQINILTYGKPNSVEFNCILFKVDSREVEQSPFEYLNADLKFPKYDSQKISIDQADSILQLWGVEI